MGRHLSEVVRQVSESAGAAPSCPPWAPCQGTLRSPVDYQGPPTCQHLGKRPRRALLAPLDLRGFGHPGDAAGRQASVRAGQK